MAKKNEKEITIKIEGKEWKDALDKAFVKANKKAKIDGFRPGKAPKEMFIKKYGIESLYMEAGDLVLESAYAKIIEENKDLELVAQPDIQLKSVDEDHIEFAVVLTTKPEVKLGDYKNLNVKKGSVKVTEAEIDSTIAEMQKRYAENVIKEEGKVEEGDIAVIDFEGFKDGVAFDGGKGENYSLTIGSHTFIPGFEEQVIGMKAGDEKDLNVTFPEDYGAKDLAGAPVVFKVKVNEVKEKKTRELDEDFFEDLGMEGIDSEDKLKAEIKESIKAQKEMDAENKYVDSLLEGVSKNVEVDIPEEMVNEEVDRLMGRFAEQMKMQGISLDLYYQFTGSNEEQLRSQMEKEAFNNVLYRLMIEEIQQIEKIVVSDEDAEKEAEELAKKYQMDKEDFLNQFGGLEMVKYDLEVRKVIELLKELNK